MGVRARFALLAAAAVVVLALLPAFPALTPVPLLGVVLVLGSVLLPQRLFHGLAGVVAAGSALVAVPLLGRGEVGPVLSLAVVVASVLLLGHLARPRHRLGMTGTAAEDLLLELRQRLDRSTVLPDVPPPWRAEIAHAPAGGATLGGDLVVSSLEGDVLEVALVDVSGNGLAAAARASQLVGALGALVGSVAPERFMARANDYVVRQQWEEGFATLVHLAVDLRTGRYTLGRAGHPAPLLREADGRWSVLGGGGAPPLGVVAGASFPRLTGILRPGDLVLACSDGVSDDRAAPDDARLLRMARAAVRPGPDGAAARLVAAAPCAGEDRTVVALWRAA